MNVYVVTRIDDSGCEDLIDVFSCKELAEAYVVSAGEDYFYEEFEVKDYV